MSKEDKRKILLLKVLITCLVILIGSFIVITYLSYKSENEVKNESLSTTTRRKITTTIKNKDEELEEIEDDEPTETTTTSVSTTTKKEVKETTKKTTKQESEEITKVTKTSISKVESTTRIITNQIVTQVEPTDRETTTSDTDYPNAQNSWEWEIVNYINQEREKNGLNKLEVATDLRALAHEGADLLEDYGINTTTEYLSDYNFYRGESNIIQESKTFFDGARNATKVTTGEYLRYLGVAVLTKKPQGGLTKYYCIIIYE